ncbi:MAG: mmyG [Sphaerisporangium sp.]|nr:mmyG [Sphaerisporangium sp.]
MVLVLAAGLGLCRDGRGLFSVHMEGRQKFPTGLQIDITGTEGVLRITNDRAFENTEDNTVHGVGPGAGGSSSSRARYSVERPIFR